MNTTRRSNAGLIPVIEMQKRETEVGEGGEGQVSNAEMITSENSN